MSLKIFLIIAFIAGVIQSYALNTFVRYVRQANNGLLSISAKVVITATTLSLFVLLYVVYVGYVDVHLIDHDLLESYLQNSESMTPLTDEYVKARMTEVQ